MAVAGQGSHRCTLAWFCNVFRKDPRLSHITIASGKENFGRCSECSRFSDELKQAIKAGDAAKVLSVKRERLTHYLLERADKLSYYSVRSLHGPAPPLVLASPLLSSLTPFQPLS